MQIGQQWELLKGRCKQMKYLIQNRKEFAISVGFFIMTAVNLAKAVMSKDISEDLIVAVIYGLFGVLAWFYNMPTSKENCEHTGLMRLEKDQKNGKIDGEDFTEALEFDALENLEETHEDGEDE